MAFQQFDQLKIQIHNAIIQFKKEIIPKCSQEEQKQFETWYWKVIPQMQVDMSPYLTKSIRVPDDQPKTPMKFPQ